MTNNKKPHPGIPCDEKSLKEHLEGFSKVEESIANLYKTKGKAKCVNCSTSRKKPSKK